MDPETPQNGEAPEIVWVAIWVIFFTSWATSFVGVYTAPYLAQITRLRPSMLAPIVGVLALIGAYSLQRQFVDVIFALIFGILGYYMRRYHIPVVPLILGLLLGEATERAFFQSIQVFDQGLGVFVTRPISLVLVLITIFIFVAPMVTMHRRSRKLEEADV